MDVSSLSLHRCAAQQARAGRRRCRCRVSGRKRLCKALRIEADFGRVAARLTRRALGRRRERPTRMRVTILQIRVVHTVIFWVLSICVGYAVFSGVANRISVSTWVAVGLFLIQSVVLVVSGWTCPVTILAERQMAPWPTSSSPGGWQIASSLCVAPSSALRCASSPGGSSQDRRLHSGRSLALNTTLPNKPLQLTIRRFIRGWPRHRMQAGPSSPIRGSQLNGSVRQTSR